MWEIMRVIYCYGNLQVNAFTFFLSPPILSHALLLIEPSLILSHHLHHSLAIAELLLYISLSWIHTHTHQYTCAQWAST